MAETVVILGASTNPHRFSHKAQMALIENGHTPVPVNPKYGWIDGVACYSDLKNLPCQIDTITIYLNSDTLRTMADDILHVRPRRVIFNPGAECQEVASRLESAGIQVQNACTLILLNSDHFTR